MMDYFALAKGITNDYVEKLTQEQLVADLKRLADAQTKVIQDQRALLDSQRELIELLKAQLK